MSTDENYPLLTLSSVDIAQQASRLSASSDFPLLIEALIRTTAPELTRLDFHGSDDNLRPGWDGIVEQNSVHPYVPQGKSYWELSVRQGVKEKAESDYQKRLSEPVEVRKNSIFVWATLRTFRDARKLEDSWRARGDWKDVRVYDAEHIAQWLRQTPSLWLMAAELLRIGFPTSVHTLDFYMNRWAGQCSPKLTSALFFPQIQRYQADLLSWLKKPKESFSIYAESFTEGVAFVHAMMENEAFVPFRNRVLVFTNADEAQSFLSRAPQAIAVVEDEAIGEACVSGDTPVPVIHVTSLQAQLPQHLFYAYVGSMDYHAVDAFMATLSDKDKRKVKDAVARNGYSRSALRRSLLNISREPEWARSLSKSPTVLAVGMLGQWDPKEEQSNAAVAFLSDREKDDALQELHECLSHGESPVVYRKPSIIFGRFEKVWGSSSPREFWEYALRCLTTAQKKHYLDLVEQMLVSRTSEYRVAVLAPLCDSLLLLMELMEENRPVVHRDMAPAVRALLQRRLSSVPVSLLLHQSYLLPYMAELAPEAWSEWVESLLSLDSAKMEEVWRDEPLRFLVDALARFAIPPRYFCRSIGYLLRLWQLAPTDTARERIGKAIKKALIAWCPQTRAHAADRQRMMHRVCSEAPALGWKICMGNLARGQGGFIAVSTRRTGVEWTVPDSILVQDRFDMSRDSLELVLKWKDTTMEQLRELFSLVQFYASPWRDRVLEKVLTETAALSEQEKMPFYEQAQKMLSELRLHKHADACIWFLSNVIPPFRPKDAVLRYRQLFALNARQLCRNSDFTLLEDAVKRGNLLKRFRREYPVRFHDLLAEQQVDARALGIATAVTFPVSEIVAEWHRLVLSPHALSAQESSYLQGMATPDAATALYEPLKDLLGLCSEEQALKMLVPLAPRGLCLQLLPFATETGQHRYWQQVCIKRYSVSTDKPEWVAEQLLKAHRPAEAWVVLESCYTEYSPSLVARVIGALALSYGQRISFNLAWQFGLQPEKWGENTPDCRVFEVIAYLKEQNAVSLLRAACMELRFADMAASQGLSLPHVTELLAANPRLAARLLYRLGYHEPMEKAMGEIGICRLNSLFNQCLMYINIFAALPNDAARAEWYRVATAELERLSAPDDCRSELTQFLVGGNLLNIDDWLTDEMARMTEPYLLPPASIASYSSKLMGLFRWASVMDSMDANRRKRLLCVQLRNRVSSLKDLGCFRLSEVLELAIESLAWEADYNDPVE